MKTKLFNAKHKIPSGLRVILRDFPTISQYNVLTQYKGIIITKKNRLKKMMIHD